MAKLKHIYGDEVVLESAGAAVNNNVLSAASTAELDLLSAGNNQGLLHCHFVLEITYSVAPVVHSLVELVPHGQAIRTGTNAIAPSTAFRPSRKGFFLKDVTGAQSHEYDMFWVPRRAFWHIFPNAVGQNCTGWKLWARPFTTEPV